MLKFLKRIAKFYLSFSYSIYAVNFNIFNELLLCPFPVYSNLYSSLLKLL